MSKHHRQRWTTSDRRKWAAIFDAMLPVPCSKCGGAVMPGTRYDIDHRISLAQGGPSTAQNLWPSHPRCNRSSGGTEGAHKTNGTRSGKDPRGEPKL